MDLLQQIKQFCRRYNIKPARSRGQNFLVDESTYDKIVQAADLKKDDVVLEVGPGLGFLTERLAKRAKKVIAVELDDKLAKILRDRLLSRGVENVKVINGDIMKLEIGNWKLEIANSTNFKFLISNFKIIANLPYNITSIFLRKFLSVEFQPGLMVLMLQKEVAERIVAAPPKMSLLAVSVQFYAKPEIIDYVGRDNFWPRPEVDSAMIKLEVRILPAQAGKKLEVSEKEFFRLVRIGFSAKRKMLKNNLVAGYQIKAQGAGQKLKLAGFSEKVRAQELSASDWIKLFEVFRENVL